MLMCRLINKLSCFSIALAIVFFFNPAEARAKPHYTIFVLGDSLGVGLYAGIYRTIRNDDNIEVVKLSKVGSGLTRMKPSTRDKILSTVLEAEGPKLVVVMVGGNDPQPIAADNGKRYAFRTDEWRREYTSRVNGIMQDLTGAGIKTFWVGLPSMRTPDYDEMVRYINQIHEACADQNGVIYIPTRKLTVDKEGAYSAYGKDLLGRTRLLRSNDGKHFTLDGYEMIANHVLENILSNIGSFKVVQNSDQG